MEINEIIELFTEEQKKEYYEEYLSKVESLPIEFQEDGKIEQIGNIQIVKFEYSYPEYGEDEDYTDWYLKQFIVLIYNNKILKFIYETTKYSEINYYIYNNELHLICKTRWNKSADIYNINTGKHLYWYYLNKI